MNRTMRRLARLYAAAGLAYVLAGVVLIGQAVAQTRVPVSIQTTPVVVPVPQGNDDEAVQAYYDYLDLRDLQKFQETYFTNPLYLSWVYGSIGIALLLFYLLATMWYARSKGGDLYPVEVYAGYITERGGPLTTFDYVAYAVLVSYAAYYTVVNLRWGQFY